MASQVWSYDLAYAYYGTTTVATTTTKTALVPDYTIAANLLVPGSKIRAQIYGNASTASTPVTSLTFACYWGGTGGTSLATTGALTTVASASTVPFRFDWLIVCTAVTETSGVLYYTLFVQGWFFTTTALYATPAHAPIPASAPASVGSLATTATALDFAVTWGNNTAGNTITSNLYTLETLAL